MFFSVKLFLFLLYASIYLCSSQSTIRLRKDVVSAVLAFGDSFVDQGNNNYITTVAKADFLPYGKDFMGGKPTGRFSNGKTIADFFAEAFGVKEYLPPYLDPSIQEEDLLSGVSFASGGTGYDPLTPKFASVIPLPDQLDMFKEYIGNLTSYVGEEAAKNIITNSVVLVVASTNDLLLSLNIRILEYNVTGYADMLVNLALNFTQEIYNLGARRIAVFGAPPVGCLPAVRTIAGGANRMCVDRENNASQVFNTMLKSQLQLLASSLPQSTVAFVDFYNPLIGFIENPDEYDLEVTDRGCCGTGLLEVTFLCNVLTPTCDNDTKFLFWDSIHLSERGSNLFVNQTFPDLVNTLFEDNANFTDAISM